jgi:hypothetical protein
VEKKVFLSLVERGHISTGGYFVPILKTLTEEESNNTAIHLRLVYKQLLTEQCDPVNRPLHFKPCDIRVIQKLTDSNKKTELRGLSLQANYTDRATAAFR